MRAQRKFSRLINAIPPASPLVKKIRFADIKLNLHQFLNFRNLT
jgi:hypothetical protein